MHPYEYRDSFKNVFDNKLPDSYEFFSSLKDECISRKDYLHAIDLWILFKMKAGGDYHFFFFLKADVLLLAGFFEKFISMCLEYYVFDHCYCFSSPGLSSDVILKMKEVELI